MYLKLRVKVLPCLHVVSIDISFRIIAYFGAGIRFFRCLSMVVHGWNNG